MANKGKTANGKEMSDNEGSPRGKSQNGILASDMLSDKTLGNQ